MNSAIFGQLIILIVFIPILSLSGVEGKMFKPMALTFSFALIGAMILCFTYVPVAASIFIRPSTKSPKNISVRLMDFLNRSYDPIIRWALKKKKVVLAISVMLLGVQYTYLPPWAVSLCLPWTRGLCDTTRFENRDLFERNC